MIITETNALRSRPDVPPPSVACRIQVNPNVLSEFVLWAPAMDSDVTDAKYDAASAPAASNLSDVRRVAEVPERRITRDRKAKKLTVYVRVTAQGDLVRVINDAHHDSVNNPVSHLTHHVEIT